MQLDQVLDSAVNAKPAVEFEELQLSELSDLQLALVGGGIGDPIAA